MKQVYEELTHDLCVHAVLDCLNKKFLRDETLEICEKYGGVPRRTIREAVEAHNMFPILDAVEGIAYEVEERVSAILEDIEYGRHKREGYVYDLGLDDVEIRPRRDGMYGKVRDIAKCCVFHQIYGHLVFLGMKRMLFKKLLPCQCASIPGRGQTKVKDILEYNMKKGGRRTVRHVYKVDVNKAYGTTQYSVVIDRVKKDLPNATWIHAVLEGLRQIAPGGHLIIGGYIDAWMFNYLMSYALRHVSGIRTGRRDKMSAAVTMTPSYMDDVSLGGSREASVKSVVRKLSKYLGYNFGLSLKEKIKRIKLMTIEEEHLLRKMGVRRRPPGIDMGGYVVHRTYTSIRRNIFKRVRRCYIRAKRDFDELGRIPYYRATRVVSYYGYFKHTDTKGAAKKYEVKKLFAAAKKAVGLHQRMEVMKTCSI